MNGNRAPALLSGLIAVLAGAAPGSSAAQGPLAQCDAVLAGDLTNKVVSANSSSSSSRVAMREYLFSRSEDEAYDLYSKEYETGKKQGQSGGVGVNYFGIGGEADFALSYENKISRSEFGEKFRAAKKIHQSSRSSSGQADVSLASSYASHVRDSHSIEAWKACVTQQPATGLYAFGSRDESGAPSVTVVWAPGPLAGVAPRIKVEVVSPNPGVKITPAQSEVAIGSGKAFEVQAPDARKGFSIKVNGNLVSRSGEMLGSFSAAASIPPVVDLAAAQAATGPAPCTSLVKANQLYDLLVEVKNSRTGEKAMMPMLVYVKDSMPAPMPGSTVFNALFGAPGIEGNAPLKIQVEGSSILLYNEDGHYMRGTCSAQMATLRGIKHFKGENILRLKQ